MEKRNDLTWLHEKLQSGSQVHVRGCRHIKFFAEYLHPMALQVSLSVTAAHLKMHTLSADHLQPWDSNSCLQSEYFFWAPQTPNGLRAAASASDGVAVGAAVGVAVGAAVGASVGASVRVALLPILQQIAGRFFHDKSVRPTVLK